MSNKTIRQACSKCGFIEFRKTMRTAAKKNVFVCSSCNQFSDVFLKEEKIITKVSFWKYLFKKIKCKIKFMK